MVEEEFKQKWINAPHGTKIQAALISITQLQI
jgi:hypothetical protein